MSNTNKSTLEALGASHSHGETAEAPAAHRDAKPENVAEDHGAALLCEIGDCGRCGVDPLSALRHAEALIAELDSERAAREKAEADATALRERLERAVAIESGSEEAWGHAPQQLLDAIDDAHGLSDSDRAELIGYTNTEIAERDHLNHMAGEYHAMAEKAETHVSELEARLLALAREHERVREKVREEIMIERAAEHELDRLAGRERFWRERAEALAPRVSHLEAVVASQAAAIVQARTRLGEVLQ